MTVEEYNISIDQFADNIFRFILKNIQDGEKAKDIVQDAYLGLWTKLESVSFRSVKQYLFKAAYHLMIDLIRHESRLLSIDGTDLSEYTHTTHYTDINQILHNAIKQLPEIQRSVVLLRDYEGYSYEEIGQITGLNESQVKVYIFRARSFLKQYIGSLDKII